MQGCVQCGLSIGESATFCPVCGTRVGDGVAAAVETGASSAPAPDLEAGASFGPEAPESDVPELEAVTQPERQPAAGLVTRLEPVHERATYADPEAAHLDAAPVIGHSVILEAEPAAGRTELVADLALEHGAEPAVELGAESAAEPEAPGELEEPAESEESQEDVRERRMAEIAALLEFAGRCEEANPARAAVVYGEVVVGCLEVTDDPLGTGPVRRGLLCGFDRLSFVLERQGLPEEALAVVDDAASLGLLDGEDGEAAPQRGALRDRRESLRRILYGDSAHL